MNLIEAITWTVVATLTYAMIASLVGRLFRMRAERVRLRSPEMIASLRAKREHRAANAKARRRLSLRDGAVFSVVGTSLFALLSYPRQVWLDSGFYLALICPLVVLFALGTALSGLVRWLFLPEGEFRYGIKSLFLLALIVAIPGAFYAAMQSTIHRRHRSEQEALRELEAIVGERVVCDYLPRSFGVQFAWAVELPSKPLTTAQVDQVARALSRFQHLSFVTIPDDFAPRDRQRLQAALPHVRVGEYERTVDRLRSSRKSATSLP